MFLLCAQNLCLIEKHIDNDIFFLYFYVYIQFEPLIILNRTSSPEDFEFTRFDCMITQKNRKKYLKGNQSYFVQVVWSLIFVQEI